MLFHFAPFPPHSGVTKRIFHTFKTSASYNDVSVLSFGTAEEERRFRAHFSSVCKRIVFVRRPSSRLLSLLMRVWLLVRMRSSLYRSHTRKFQKALDELVSTEQFDLIHVSSSIMGFYRLPKGIPLVADTHNVEYEVLYRTYKETTHLIQKIYSWIEYRFVKREEIASSQKFDVVLATSDHDLETFRKHLPDKKMYVIPNGVDTGYFSSRQNHPAPNTIVFTGLMSYFPNDNGIQFFLREVLPLIAARVPDVRLSVVGASPTRDVLRFASDRVEVTGYVDDVRPYFDKSQVAIVPLLVGGGTRLKVLEAMSMNKPVVSTTLGCEGLDVLHGHNVLLADTPEGLADAVIRLFGDAGLRHKLSENAYHMVRQTYDWNAIGAKLQSVFEECHNPSRLYGHSITQTVSQPRPAEKL